MLTCMSSTTTSTVMPYPRGSAEPVSAQKTAKERKVITMVGTMIR